MTDDFIIIGGGPAGCSAALFAARVKRKVVMIHKGTTPLIHSFNWLLPGFPNGLGPAEWLKNMRSQIETSGFTFVEGEAKFVGHGVFYNAYQDASLCDGQSVVVEGKNDQAIREALYLSRFASKIYFIVPAMKLEADEKLIGALRANPNVNLLLSASIKKIEGENQLEGVTVLSAGEEKKIEAKAVFLFARQSKPKYDFLKGTIEISEEGCVLVDDQMMTSIPGVFACGDMLSGAPQLQFVSAAQGLVAAMNADRYLSNPNL